VADLVKDAIVLPWAFVCAKEEMTEQEFIAADFSQKFYRTQSSGFHV
jgi:CRISPR-associated protein Cas1